MCACVYGVCACVYGVCACVYGVCACVYIVCVWEYGVGGCAWVFGRKELYVSTVTNIIQHK